MLLSPAARQIREGQWKGERKTGEQETAVGQLVPEEKCLAASPHGLPLLKVSLQPHPIRFRERGETGWMDSNGAEAGAWAGMVGMQVKAGLCSARLHAGRCPRLHPAAMPHSTWTSPEPCHSSSLSPPPPPTQIDQMRTFWGNWEWWRRNGRTNFREKVSGQWKPGLRVGRPGPRSDSAELRVRPFPRTPTLCLPLPSHHFPSCSPPPAALACCRQCFRAFGLAVSSTQDV